MRNRAALSLGVALILCACSPLSPATPTAEAPGIVSESTETQAATEIITPEVTPTPTQAPTASATPTATPTPLILSHSEPIAFLHDQALVIAETTGQTYNLLYTHDLGTIQDIGVLRWSPDQQRIAFEGKIGEQRHIFAVSISDGRIMNLGEGDSPAWAPDNSRIVYRKAGGAIWLASVNGEDQFPLTMETDWWWGSPIFTPDGSAVLAAGNSTDAMIPRGAGVLKLIQINPDGSGETTTVSDNVDVGRVPRNAQFSLDGRYLAWVSELPVSGMCGAETAYYVLQPTGKIASYISYLPLPDQTSLTEAEQIFRGYNFSWRPQGDKLAVTGQYVNCAGTPLTKSTLYLVDYQNNVVPLPGEYDYPSYNSSGILIAVQAGEENNTHVLLVSETGEVVLDLGAGSQPAFAPIPKT